MLEQELLQRSLGRNQGPTRLDYCEIDTLLLADGLRGNSRLKSFSPYFSCNFDICNRELLATADAIRENNGLVEWCPRCYCIILINDGTWDAICDSLKMHPTLEVLNLSKIYHHEAVTAQAVLKPRIQAIVDMLKVNTSIHTIRLSEKKFSNHELYRGSAIPYLETNKFRLRVRAIQKTLPFGYRAKVLGRALLAVQDDPNRFWMLLSGNAEIAFPSTSATTTLATNLPTPATVAVTVAAIRATSTTGASTAASPAPTAACQKRKAHS
jgi:hypothetical protein